MSFDEIAIFYDLLKAHRDYGNEAWLISQIIEAHQVKTGSLLEFACGTGSLLEFFPGTIRVGVDLSRGMLGVARKKSGLEKVKFIYGNMIGTRVGRQFDVVLCMDGAIGYVKHDELNEALNNFISHVKTDGLLVVEPWYDQYSWEPNKVRTVQREQNGLNVVRVSYGMKGCSILFNLLIDDGMKVKIISECYDFYLHDQVRIIRVLEGFDAKVTIIEPNDTFNRGLIVAKV